MSPPAPLPDRWPAPADRAAGARLVAQLVAPTDPPGLRDLLDCLGGNSPYLGQLAVAEAATLRQLAARGPDPVLAEALRGLAAVSPAAERPAIAAALRQAKRRVALATAIADIAGLWTLEQVTAALSDLAEATLSLATAHLLRAAHVDGALRLPDLQDPARGSGFVVLGMGKLGARELNYSSDVDLILLYDPELHSYHADRLGGVFTRLARDLVTLMEQRGEGGYVFRTDLRLRPDPGATPPAISLPGALTYYEGLAQTWERAAMIKARPVAGDRALGARFLEAIRPFIWRRHLDFAAIADIRAMKQRIDAHKGAALPPDDAPERLAGYNLKLGAGGIREIEFIAQTLQLVWGGRNPALRAPATIAALHQLGDAGKLPMPTVLQLEQAYRFLRRAEHRLQMVADRQTHSLPDKPAELAAFAGFLGVGDLGGLAAMLHCHLRPVHEAFAGLFTTLPHAPDLAPAGPRLAAAGGSLTEAELRRLGFRQPEAMGAVIAAWRAGRPRALRSDRARALLEEILPGILGALARQTEPDAAFARFARFLDSLPAGVQPLSLFQHNPALLDRVASVLGAAPSLAEHLAAVPAALEGLLAPQDIDPDPRATLARELADAPALEDALAIARRAVRGEEFRLALAEMEGRIDIDRAAAARTALADASIDLLLARVLDAHRRRYGRVHGGGMAVVVLGKAGSREMMAGSDLDLMVVYDCPAESSESRGPRPLPVSQYYARAAQALIAALTVPTREGPLYALDMRLRPSGNQGPVAVSLAAFRRYHAGTAWTWERMALTRARVVAGPAALQRRVAGAIREALRRAGAPASIRADAAAMRARLLRELPARTPWDVKLRPGGLLEVEFIAQTLQLLHARKAQLLDPNTRAALENLARAGLLGEEDAALLIRADRIWRTVQGLLRILLGRAIPEELPVPTLRTLCGALAREAPELVGAEADATVLEAGLDRLAAAVRAAFVRLVAPLSDEPGRAVSPGHLPHRRAAR